jgi:hypothetical protein
LVTLIRVTMKLSPSWEVLITAKTSGDTFKGFISGQDGCCPWPEDHAPLCGREFALTGKPDEEIFIFRIADQELNEPPAFG